MSKIKNGGLDQYGVGPFEQQQFGTAGVEEVNESESLPRFAHGFSPMLVIFSFFAVVSPFRASNVRKFHVTYVGVVLSLSRKPKMYTPTLISFGLMAVF